VVYRGRFDDRRGHEDIGFVVHKFQHHFFQFTFRHLAVADKNARLWN